MYTFQARLPLTVEQAIPEVLERLRREGFGVLRDLDIQATMKQKIGAGIPAYHILGACNPQRAHQALQGGTPLQAWQQEQHPTWAGRRAPGAKSNPA